MNAALWAALTLSVVGLIMWVSWMAGLQRAWMVPVGFAVGFVGWLSVVYYVFSGMES